MNQVRLHFLFFAVLLFASLLPAQTPVCLDFEELPSGTIYSPATGYAAGDSIFTEENVVVSVDEFFLSNGNTAFVSTSVLPVPASFPPPIAVGQGLFPNNMNLVFDFSNLAGPLAGIGFAFQDQGGLENFSVNGHDLFIVESFSQLPAVVAPGVTAQVFFYPGIVPPVGAVFLTGPVFSLTVGGQELVLDNFCYTIENANPDCNIAELSATPLPCNEDGDYFALVDFIPQNASAAGFQLDVDGQPYGTYLYSDLPLEIGPYAGDSVTAHAILVTDLANPDCQADASFGPVDCLNQPCIIYDLVVETTPCENGQFYVVLDFEYNNVGNEGFKVQGNGVNYGAFEYADLPITIGPLVGDGVTVYEFAVIDIAHPDCHDATFIDPVDCGGGFCDIFELVVDPGECNGEGFYNLYIDFEVSFPGNDYFEVHYGSENLGLFALADLPITIENFHDDGEEVVHIYVCINDQPDCCELAEFESPCPGSGCHIYDLVYDLSDCIDGYFHVTLNFQYENVGGEGFKVTGNGVIYGTFEYSELPITIGPLLGDGVTPYEFAVSDLLHPDCHDAVEVGPVDCGAEPCEIYELVVDPGECNGEGQYNLYIDFLVQNPGNDFFEVFYNNESLGFFALADLPVTIENFSDNGEEWVHIKVCINDQPLCCKVAEFLSPCPGSVDCHIYDLVYELSDCEDGFFYIHLNFQYENVGGEGFNVHGNGVNYGNFEYSELPIVIGPLSGDGVTPYEFAVNDVLHPDCHDAVEVGVVDCPGGENVWPGDANSDNIANNVDLLNLGIAFGANGPTRDVSSIVWQGWPSQDWVETFPSGVNFKHADCDGTGSIDAGDIQAIELNYNETHGTPEPVQYSTGTEEDPPLYADLPEDGSVGPGDPITVPIVLGTENHPVEGIYGIAFTLVFNPDVIEPSSVDLAYPNSWLGAPGVNMITIDKKFVEEGIIDVALSRIDSNPASGYGEILGFIGIIDDVLGKQELEIGVEKVRAIHFNEEIVHLYFPQESIIISSATEPAVQTDGISVFPNPASDILHWILAGKKRSDYAAVIDINGRIVQEQFGSSADLSLHALPAGMYWLKVRSGGEFFLARFAKTSD